MDPLSGSLSISEKVYVADRVFVVFGLLGMIARLLAEGGLFPMVTLFDWTQIE